MLNEIGVALEKLTIAVGLLQIAIAQVSQLPLPEKKVSYETQGEIRTMIVELARYHNISTILALELGRIESRFNPLIKNPSSTATGLYQFIDSTWRGYCKGDRLNPYDNTKCAMERLQAGELWHWTSDKNTKRKLQEVGLIE